MGIDPTKITNETSPVFSWTANLITLNRRKVMVVINDKSKCCFILYGLTSKHIKKLPELIVDGIRAMMESEYVAPEIIEKYLNDCGRGIVLTTASSRSNITYCNKACERATFLSGLFDADDIFQKKFLPWLNDEVIAKDNYATVYKRFINALEEEYGAPVQSAHMAELEINLNLLTRCTRTILVPSDINFYSLHRIIQNLFEWEDYHYHQFVLEKNKLGRPMKIIQPEFMHDEEVLNINPLFQMMDSEKITVREVFEKQTHIEYEYDFGDGWNHTVELKRFIENYAEPYPHCIELIGTAPMEDCGGPYGFDDIMKILDDPEHPEYNEVTSWLGKKEWRSSDLKWINFRIKDRHRFCVSTN